MTTPADPWTGCRREHRRSGRTAPARRTARRPAADWRRRESSPAVPPCRANVGRAYKGGAGTCGGTQKGSRGPLIARARILIKDCREIQLILCSIDQPAVQRRQESIVENILGGWP